MKIPTIELSEIIKAALAEVSKERKKSKANKYNTGFYDGEEFELKRLIRTLYPEKN